MNRISGKLHANSLLKRGRDFIPVAILVTALFALLALSMWFAAYAWTHLGGDPIPAYAANHIDSAKSANSAVTRIATGMKSRPRFSKLLA